MKIQAAGVRLEDLNRWGNGNLIGALGIEFVEITNEYLKARMPVEAKTHQTFGMLHGGASVVLAETVGSIGANLCVDGSKQSCVGLEINANHVKAVTSGWVIATAKPLNISNRFQIWQIEIRDENNDLVCVSRLTMAIIERPIPKF